MTMSDFLGHVYSAPSRRYGSVNIDDERYDYQLRSLLAYAKQPGPITTDLTEYLDVTNPALHSLSFLFLLRLQIQQLQKRSGVDIPEHLLPGGYLWNHSARFLRSFDPIQIRYAGHEWRQLVELMASAAQINSKPALAVKIMKDALERLENPGVFISAHLIIVKLALLSSSYISVLPVLDELLCHFPTATQHGYTESILCSEQESNAVFITDTSGFSTALTYRDHLQFYIYSAMIYMAVKRWDRASHCLSVVISSPTANAVSKIMVEAYKKWILVNLLWHGKLHPVPSLIAPHVTRVYQSLSKPYISLAEMFEKGDLPKLNAEISLGQSIWQADNNAGLVYQVFEAYDKFAIVKLERTFSALTMPDVLQRSSTCSKGLDEIEGFVVSLVMSNSLKATLSHPSSNQNTAMLRFCLSTQGHTFREEQIRAGLIQRSVALKTIAEAIAQTDNTLELSQENLQSLVKNQKWSGGPEKPGAGGGDIDEDLMGDGH